MKKWNDLIWIWKVIWRDLIFIKVSSIIWYSYCGTDVLLKKKQVKISRNTVMYHTCVFRGQAGLNKTLSKEKLSACRLMLKHDVEISSAIHEVKK